MLNVLSSAMRIKEDIKLDNLPRMADWALWGYAVAESMGMGGEVFLKSYEKNIMMQHDEIVESDPVAKSVQDIAFLKGSWQGTPTDLYLLAAETVDAEQKKGRGWPKSAAAFTKRLKTVSHSLRERGVNIKHIKGRYRTISLRCEESMKLRDKTKQRLCRLKKLFD